ncbi:MAG: cysteine desulfurase [Clostridia bacterium]|nr:cysteine desulfurase [Clostridia bacterium]
MDVNIIKKDFPIFNNSEFVYLDSGATSQKPKVVLDRVISYYENDNANPFRGAYNLSIKSTEDYNNARDRVAKFINAKHNEEIIFTKNATESLNLIANTYGIDNLNSGDEVVLSIMEHHSNIVPWQRVCKLKNAKLNYFYINENFEIDEKEIETKITEKTKIVGIVSVSNVLGTINNIDKIIEKTHSVGAIVIVDISQSIAHQKFDVQKTNADFVVFSGHKMLGPFGIGVLYAKKEILENMSPFLMGGDMIEFVYEQETTFASLPNKFEAGTQNVGGAVGLSTAIDYLENIGYEEIQKHEKELITYAYEKLSNLPYIKIYASKNLENVSSVLSFNIDGIHPHDIASFLDASNICIRAGNHCAQPLMRYIGIDSTCRISFAIYNTKDDIDKLIFAIEKIYAKFEKFINKNK